MTDDNSSAVVEQNVERNVNTNDIHAGDLVLYISASGTVQMGIVNKPRDDTVDIRKAGRDVTNTAITINMKQIHGYIAVRDDLGLSNILYHSVPNQQLAEELSNTADFIKQIDEHAEPGALVRYLNTFYVVTGVSVGAGDNIYLTLRNGDGEFQTAPSRKVDVVAPASENNIDVEDYRGDDK